MSEEKKVNETVDKKKMLDSLIGDKNTPKKKSNRIKQSFTMTIHEGTVQLFNEIQFMKEYLVDIKPTTRDAVLREALEALGREIGYDELKKKHADKLQDCSPRLGRSKVKR